MRKQITIVGLGPGDAGLLTYQTVDAMRHAATVVLRTARHPAVTALPQLGIRYRACDDLYETHDRFEEVYRAVVERVLEAAADGPVTYAVPGDPLVAEQTVRLLLEMADPRDDVTVTVLPALGALNLILSHLPDDPGDGLLIADARDPRLRPLEEAPAVADHAAYHGAQSLITPTLPTIWFQVDTPLVASNLKVLLLDQYPADHPVTILTAVGVEGEEQVTTLPLEELDRVPVITHLTSLYVPALAWEQRRHTVTDLRALMALLRSPHGCPWDREQDMTTIRRTVIEEAYEVVAAIDRDDPTAIADELGDLLLNIIFLAQLGAEEGVFTFDDVVQAMAEKLIRRHAHVFGEAEAATASAVVRSWETIKAGERERKGETSIFDDVPMALPALARSQKLQKRAARVGFDWADFRGPMLKVHEELVELSEEIGVPTTWSAPDLGDPLVLDAAAQQRAESAPKPRLLHEVGDILFAAVNLARFLHLDAEETLREANDRFMRRFHRVEAEVHRRGHRVEELPLAELDAIWVSIKGED